MIAPLEAACMKLFAADYYAGLALTLRRGEEYMPEMLLEHLLSVGYARVDVVEMPGQVTVRGGIMDVYSPEMDRPVRIDFFGDEIEKHPQVRAGVAAVVHSVGRSSAASAHRDAGHGEAARGRARAADEVRERRSGRRHAAVSVFPGWEFFAPVAGARANIFDLLAAQG